MDLNGLNRCFFTITHTSVRFDTIQRKISGISGIRVNPKMPLCDLTPGVQILWDQWDLCEP